MQNMAFRIVFVATLAVLSGANAAEKESGGDKATVQKWAVLVGINDYSNMKTLEQCRNDAEGLRRQLIKAGFHSDNIVLLADGAKRQRHLPFKANIERQLKLVLSGAEKGDLVVVSFSGHGVHIGGKSYLCPSEALEDNVEKTMISVDDVYRRLHTCRAAFKLLLVDACRNDPRLSGSRNAAHARNVRGLAETLKKPPAGIMVLASCAPGQLSWEDEKLGHGVFMHYVLEGLAGKADREAAGNRNRRVSLLELYDYCNVSTKRFVRLNRNDLQTPMLWGETTGNFDLGVLGPAEPPKDFTNSIGMKFKLIPAGEFMMGSPDEEKDRSSDEGPVHRVRITKPYYLGVHEVRVGDFRKFVSDSSYKTEGEKDGKGGYGYDVEKGSWSQKPEYTWRNPGFSQSDEHPVVNVSWNDAVAYCEWLSKKEGREYRLPTESQWEYACRAGSKTRFHHGDDAEGLASVGNVADGTAKEKFPKLTWAIEAKDGYAVTAPVGEFKANAFGLHDMHGNVWEWCSDWYGSDYYGNSQTDDPTGPTSGSLRVLRGGSWSDNARYCRSALRLGPPPGYRSINLGFRIALVPSE